MAGRALMTAAAPGRGRAFPCLLLCLWAPETLANAGVPLFSKFIVYTWLLLLPIVAFETYVVWKLLRVTSGRAFLAAGVANLASAFAGSLAVLGVGLLAAGTGISEMPGAAGDLTVLLALVPCFYLSVWIETRVAAPVLKGCTREAVRRAFLQANLLSYIMLAALPIARFVKNAIVQGGIVW